MSELNIHTNLDFYKYLSDIYTNNEESIAQLIEMLNHDEVVSVRMFYRFYKTAKCNNPTLNKFLDNYFNELDDSPFTKLAVQFKTAIMMDRYETLNNILQTLARLSDKDQIQVFDSFNKYYEIKEKKPLI